MKNSAKKIIILAATLFLVSLAGYFFWFKPKGNNPNAAMMAMMNMPAEVDVVKIAKNEIQRSIELPARVSAYKIADVRPQIDGVIKSRKFVEGSFVNQGQQLYQIDPTIYQSALEGAKANYKSLLAKRDRNRSLLKVGGISKQGYESIEADLAQAKAQLERAKANVAYTKVYAPISGYIGKSNITEGALVSANQSQVLTTITQLDPIYVDMTQATKDILRFNNQKEISVNIITEDPNYKNVGQLKFTEVFADSSTDSVRLRALFSNKDRRLIPGMFVNVKLNLKPVKAITISQKAAIRKADGDLSVFVVDANNIAKSRTIKAQEAYNDSWIVTEGLNEGDIVIVEGTLKISDGSKVKPSFLDLKKTAK